MFDPYERREDPAQQAAAKIHNEWLNKQVEKMTLDMDLKSVFFDRHLKEMVSGVQIDGVEYRSKFPTRETFDNFQSVCDIRHRVQALLIAAKYSSTQEIIKDELAEALRILNAALIKIMKAHPND